jgi:hypothetical protein
MGILTNISGKLRSSSSPNDDSLTDISTLHGVQPVARLIARNTFCQFDRTSATPILARKGLKYFQFHQLDNVTLIPDSPFVKLTKLKDRVIVREIRILLVSLQCGKLIYEVGGNELVVDLMKKNEG